MPIKTQVKLGKTLGYVPLGYYPKEGTIFNTFFENSRRVDTEQGMEGIDGLLLLGGEDVHPSYYNEECGKYTGTSSKPSFRDTFEWGAMKYCIAKNLPIFAICRGAQFACVAAGGKLIQHVEKHNQGNHMIKSKDNEVCWTNSVHHQMMYPYDIDHEMLAWTHPTTNKVYLDGQDCQIEAMAGKKEPEIVFFPSIRALAIQGHPEYGTAPYDFKVMCHRFAEEYLSE